MAFSPAEIEQRRALAPRPEFPPELPICAKREEIAKAIASHPVVIVCGETGSGKTTQLPKICLGLGRGIEGLIGHTQPRRIAARATAARLAHELKAELGGAVGYKIRFTDRVGPRSYIKIMTDGILLAETQGDRELRQYDTLIIDEAHERSLNIDFLLGYVKQLLPRRPDLKLVITSATIDAERFSRHFELDGKAAPVIEVSGRLYPVEVRYHPVESEDDDYDLNEAISDAAEELAREGQGDVLVFLPGEREIRDAGETLRKHHPPQTEILPLFARLAELGAVDEANGLTEIGKQLARLPVDPRIGRMVLAAKSENALGEVLVIAAALSVQDPRQRPGERAAAADEAQKQFNDEKSDFLSWIKLWEFFDEALEHRKSSRKLHQSCREHFLSFNRMREWREIHRQLKELVVELGWAVSDTLATYKQVHRALLAGLVGNVGTKTEEGNYLGPRGIRFWIHPGSGVRRKAGRWVMAAELTETTRLYARCVATVEPEWLEATGAHLVKRHHYEPHLEKQPARVAALEGGTLFGLLLYSNRRLHYGPADPAGSRKAFSRQALVEGDYAPRAPCVL